MEVGERWNKYPTVFPSTEINKAFTCQPEREGHTVYAEQKRERPHTDTQMCIKGDRKNICVYILDTLRSILYVGLPLFGCVGLNYSTAT